MTDLDKMLTATLVFSQVVAEALVSKGILTHQDLQDALSVLNYESPIPPQVVTDVRSLIVALPGDSSASGTPH